MKLQINAGQAAAFAYQAGPYKNLTESSQAVLDVFHQNGHDPYTRRDVCAVLTAMGGPADPTSITENGEEGWKVINAVTKGESSPKGRGYYTQKNRPPLAKPPTPSAAPEEHAEEMASLAERGVVIEQVDGLAWVPQEAEASPEKEGWYAEDEGLRQIAVSQSSCFGNFVLGNVACDVCPLARWCAASGLASLDSVVSQLDSETEKEIQDAERAYENARLAAEAAARAAARAARRPSAPAPSPSRPSAPSPSASAPMDWPAGYKEVPLPFDGVCSECDGTIPGGSKGVHLTGVGMLHIECARNRIAQGR